MRSNHPTVADGGGALDGCVGVRGDPDRRPRSLQGLGIDGYVLELKGSSLEAHIVLSPESLDDFHAFNEALIALSLGQVEGVQFLFAIAQAEGGKGFTIVENVDTSQLARHSHGMAQTE